MQERGLGTRLDLDGLEGQSWGSKHLPEMINSLNRDLVQAMSLAERQKDDPFSLFKRGVACRYGMTHSLYSVH